MRINFISNLSHFNMCFFFRYTVAKEAAIASEYEQRQGELESPSYGVGYRDPFVAYSYDSDRNEQQEMARKPIEAAFQAHYRRPYYQVRITRKYICCLNFLK